MAKLSEATLIGLTGVMNAGKDTVANLIIARLPRGIRRYSFATPLKAGVMAMFGWTPDQIEDRQFKEAIDPRWGFTPRKAMQLLGTEYGRNLLRDDLWVHAAGNFVAESMRQYKTTVITDVRFENEADWVRDQPGGVLLHVVNPEHDYRAPVAHVSEKGIKWTHEDEIIHNDKRLGLGSLDEALDKIW